LIHRKVWIENNGEIPKGYIIHHKDGNKYHNDLDNLELLTYKEHRNIHSQIKTNVYKD
jgi:hypothetical protein